MTPRQQELVRTSFSLVLSQEERITELLYQELFRLEPSTKALFRGDINEQRKKLMRMLQIAVENLGDKATLQTMLFNLGMIHQSYGVEEHHFVSFGKSLNFALKSVLKDAFTPEVEASWIAAYHYFAVTMKNFPHGTDAVQVPHN
ncbi:MAG: globin domain-containing protein [Bacteroidota bacterium]|nr:globin domain-containing protein [Bacteroidota bacterium]